MRYTVTAIHHGEVEQTYEAEFDGPDNPYQDLRDQALAALKSAHPDMPDDVDLGIQPETPHPDGVIEVGPAHPTEHVPTHDLASSYGTGQSTEARLMEA